MLGFYPYFELLYNNNNNNSILAGLLYYLQIASWAYGKDKIRLHAHTEHSLEHYTGNFKR